MAAGDEKPVDDVEVVVATPPVTLKPNPWTVFKTVTLRIFSTVWNEIVFVQKKKEREKTV